MISTTRHFSRGVLRGWVLALAVLASPFAGPAGAVVLGLDASLLDDSNLEKFQTIIINQCPEIRRLTAFESGDLEGLDGLILRQALSGTGALTGREIAAIRAFVSRGGNLLVMAEAGSRSNESLESFNALAGSYGVTFSSLVFDVGGRLVTGFRSDKITSAVSSAGVDFHRPMIRIDPPAVDLTVGDETGEQILAVVPPSGGAGTVVFLSDSSLWFDPNSESMFPISAADNRRLLLNVLLVVATGPNEIVAGTVNLGVGCRADVLFFNGSPGLGEDRVVVYDPSRPFEIIVKRPPAAVGAPAPVPFVLYLWRGEPSSRRLPLPFGIGCLGLPSPLTGGLPQPDLIYNNARRFNALGSPNRDSSPAPFRTVEANFLNRGDLYLQGLIFDPGSAAEVRASVTNGVQARVR